MPFKDFHLRMSSVGDAYAVLAQYGQHTASEPMASAVDRHAALNDAELTLPEVQAAGTALFEALIKGQIAALYHRARGAVEIGGMALRMRLHFNPHDARTQQLIRVPWEILFDAHDGPGRFLALDPTTPIVRTIDTTARVRPPSRDPIRRALLVVSTPSDRERLDIDHESDLIARCFTRIGWRAETLPHARRDTLLRRLQEGDFQIVHVMGHGTQPVNGDEGALWLEDASGHSDPVPSSTFADMFAGIRAPHVVCLATCHSANPGQRSSMLPFGSVAAALAGTGLPAVVAMRTAMRDESVLELTTRMYERIVEGQSVEEALAHARALLRVRPTIAEWIVPLMYTQSEAVVPAFESRTASRTRPGAPAGQSNANALINIGTITINEARDITFTVGKKPADK